MPRVTRYMVGCALLHLVLALVLGVVVAAPGTLVPRAWTAPLRPAWLHLLTLGWITQLILGVAHWLFPRPGEGSLRPGRHDGPEWAAWAALNLGVLLRLATEPALRGLGTSGLARTGSHAAGGGAVEALLPWGPVASALLALGGVLIMVVRLWPRLATR